MSPNTPAANPTSLNGNQPFGGYGQAQSDFSNASNILSYLPTQESQTTSAAKNANTNPGSILPNISINAPTYTAPTAPTITAGNYGNDLNGYNAATQNAMNGLTAAENQTYGAAQGALSSAEQQYGNITPVYQQLAGEYNIPGYQSDIANLSNLLQNLGRDVNSQTTLGGGAMTESARDEMYSNEAQPLNIALNNAGTFLNYGQQDVNNLLDTYEKSLTNALTPLETNISNLPGLFSQTNQTAQTGYGQGATSIENTIQNQQNAQRIAIDKANLALTQKEVNANYGNANLSSLFSGGQQSTANGNTYSGATLKNPKLGGSAGYDFTNKSGQPVSAEEWGIENGVSPAALLGAMAQNGDNTAAAALSEIQNAGGVTSDIANKYSSLFWTPGGNNTSTSFPSISSVGTSTMSPGNGLSFNNPLSFNGSIGIS